MTKPVPITGGEFTKIREAVRDSEREYNLDVAIMLVGTLLFGLFILGIYLLTRH